MNRLFPLLLICATVLRLAAGDNGPDAVRCICVVDASSSMRPKKEQAVAALKDLVASGFEGALAPGELFAVWTFNEQVNTNRIWPQKWNSPQALSMAEVAGQLIAADPFEKRARFDRLTAQLKNFSVNQDLLLAVILTDGDHRISGTTFDGAINSFARATEAQIRPSKGILTETVALSHGKFVAWDVQLASKPFRLPELPESVTGLLRKAQRVQTSPVERLELPASARVAEDNTAPPALKPPSIAEGPKLPPEPRPSNKGWISPPPQTIEAEKPPPSHAKSDASGDELRQPIQNTAREPLAEVHIPRRNLPTSPPVAPEQPNILEAEAVNIPSAQPNPGVASELPLISTNRPVPSPSDPKPPVPPQAIVADPIFKPWHFFVGAGMLLAFFLFSLKRSKTRGSLISRSIQPPK